METFTSEFKYFVIDTNQGGTMVFVNKDTYDDRVDELIEPYFITDEQLKRINEHVGGVLPPKSVISFNTKEDDVAVIERLHRGIYEVIGHDIKQHFIKVYGDPEMVVGIWRYNNRYLT